MKTVTYSKSALKVLSRMQPKLAARIMDKVDQFAADPESQANNVKALAGSPFVKARKLDLTRLRGPRVLFEGSPDEAVSAFPQNINVGATMMLASLLPAGRPPRAGGVKRLPPATIRIIADPALRMNVHELEVEGDCGRVRCRVESKPSATNPKTSEIAVRSALATLSQLFAPIRIGT